MTFAARQFGSIILYRNECNTKRKGEVIIQLNVMKYMMNITVLSSLAWVQLWPVQKDIVGRKNRMGKATNKILKLR